MEINETIREYRKKHGLTQAELASRIGVDRTTIVKYESGKNEPTWDIVCKMQDVFRDGFITDAMEINFDYENTFEHKLIEKLSYIYASECCADDGTLFDIIITNGKKKFVVNPDDVKEFCDRSVELLAVSFKHFLLDKGTFNGMYSDGEVI